MAPMASQINAGVTSPAVRTELNDEEFGPLESKEYLYVQHPLPSGSVSEEDSVPFVIVLGTYFAYLVLILVGHFHDFWDRLLDADYKAYMSEDNGYAPLIAESDSFYTRRLKSRLNDCFSRPSTGVPGRYINVFVRHLTGKFWKGNFIETGEIKRCINLGSYNYLGFAQSSGQCADAAEESINTLGLTAGAPRFSGGTSAIQVETEKLIAEFVGKEDCMVCSMGYSTNAAFFANILDKKCLVISDEHNHASIRTGLRLSGAVLQVCKHNDIYALEQLIREQIAQGQPRSHRPWKKIFVVVEGLYSMEGTMCPLPELVELRKKYGFYLFIDEAHSIGALGPRGRGVCDYYNVDPANIDILMGTFTKSFGSAGGYIAGSKRLINKLRVSNMLSVYSEAPSPPVLAQILSSVGTIMGRVNPGEAKERLQRLAFNSRYLRIGLQKMGFIVSGHIDSPIVPVMLYYPSKIAMASRALLKRGIAVVVVGYPATPLLSSRIRLCVSAALTKSDLDTVLQELMQLGDDINLRNSTQKLQDGKSSRLDFDEIKDTLVHETLTYVPLE